jgi:hypothetical protein
MTSPPKSDDIIASSVMSFADTSVVLIEDKANDAIFAATNSTDAAHLCQNEDVSFTGHMERRYQAKTDATRTNNFNRTQLDTFRQRRDTL